MNKDLEMIKKNGMNLSYVIEQTEEICLEAVKQNGIALQFVDEHLLSYKDGYYYMDGIENKRMYICKNRKLIVNIMDDETLFSIGCQVRISKEQFIDRIYNKDGGFDLEKGINVHRQEYLDILKNY